MSAYLGILFRAADPLITQRVYSAPWSSLLFPSAKSSMAYILILIRSRAPGPCDDRQRCMLVSGPLPLTYFECPFYHLSKRNTALLVFRTTKVRRKIPSNTPTWVPRRDAAGRTLIMHWYGNRPSSSAGGKSSGQLRVRETCDDLRLVGSFHSLCCLMANVAHSIRGNPAESSGQKVQLVLGECAYRQMFNQRRQ